MAALVSELNFQGLSRASISSRLYKNIDWAHMQSAGVFLSKEDEIILQNAQNNLDTVLDNENDTSILVTLLMRIADNCTFDRSVQLYVFTRIEEIFGLSNTSKSSSLGELGLSKATIAMHPLFPQGAVGNILHNHVNVHLRLVELSITNP